MLSCGSMAANYSVLPLVLEFRVFFAQSQPRGLGHEVIESCDLIGQSRRLSGFNSRGQALNYLWGNPCAAVKMATRTSRSTAAKKLKTAASTLSKKISTFFEPSKTSSRKRWFCDSHANLSLTLLNTSMFSSLMNVGHRKSCQTKQRILCLPPRSHVQTRPPHQQHSHPPHHPQRLSRISWHPPLSRRRGWRATN